MGSARSMVALSPPISVVIPTRNRLPMLLATLDALAQQREVPLAAVEVVVVVDGSADGTAGRLHEMDTPFQLRVVEKQHAGAAAAREIGWRAARAELVLFLDDDVVADRGLLSAHLGAHADARDRVVLGAIAAPRMRRPAWVAYEDRMSAKKGRRLELLEVPAGIHYAGNVSLSRHALEEAGGFEFRMPFEAHVVLGERLRRLGYHFLYLPEANGTHVGETSLAEWMTRYRVKGRTDVALARTSAYPGGMESLVGCFHDRHLLNRLAVRAALGKREREQGLAQLLARVGVNTQRLGLGAFSAAALSACANLLYWSGIRDGLRDDRLFWGLVRSTRNFRGRPYQLVASGRRPPA